ncbi:MAG TPA: ThuA domain-containing protein [Actinokineospora sp.]|nr:ThuA domain-containing protein [Actinokineospora sp.]
MTTMRSLALSILAVALAAVGCSTTPSAGVATSTAAADPAYQVLVFSKTADFRHDAIAVGVQALRDLGTVNNFTVTATEDAATFTAANLAQYEAVVFMLTTGDVLDAAQQGAFESYIKGGGGYLGVHSAADTEYDWPFYGELVGAYFASHPAIQQATVRVEDRAHAATAHIGQTWPRTDEWYNYKANPRSTAHVLASLDESTYTGGTPGGHPHAWCKTYQGGRSFYTGGGHTQASYADSVFRAHLLGGLRYAAGRAKADCRPENGYTALYNGSATGWAQAGPGSFTNADATLSSVGGLGLYWYSAKQFGSYSLKLDWKVAGDDNSGIFVGVPSGSDPASGNRGFEVQIDATDVAAKTTGSVYGIQSADIAARDAALNPSGEWNTFELLVVGERLRVFLNGVQVNDFTNTDATRSLRGHIGLQNHGTGDDVSFRDVRVKELNAVQAENWSSASGLRTTAHTNAHGGSVLGHVNPGDWVGYHGVDLTGVTSLTARVAGVGSTGGFDVRVGSATGARLGSVTVPVTGGWGTYADVTTALTGVPAGPQDLYLVFTGTQFDVDDFTLTRGARVGPIAGVAGKCVDVSGGSSTDGAALVMWTCHGGANQRWSVLGDGTLRTLGKCMALAGGGTANGTKAQLRTCDGTDAQVWAAQSNGSLRDQRSGRCLDASGGSSSDGAALIVWDCHGGTNQRWVLPA